MFAVIVMPAWIAGIQGAWMPKAYAIPGAWVSTVSIAIGSLIGLLLAGAMGFNKSRTNKLPIVHLIKSGSIIRLVGDEYNNSQDSGCLNAIFLR